MLGSLCPVYALVLRRVYVLSSQFWRYEGFEGAENSWDCIVNSGVCVVGESVIKVAASLEGAWKGCK